MNWLKERRRELNINQDQLAAKLQLQGVSVTSGAISHWETGRHRPPFDDPRFCQALANTLEMDISTMLQLAGYDVVRPPRSEQAEQAADIIDHMPPEKKDLALRVLKELAK